MNKTTKNMTVVIGVVMTIAMVASLITPLLSSQVNTAQPEAIEPTTVPLPTLPPPPDTSNISFENTFLHPSGLLTVGVPTGWQPTVQTNSATEVRSSFGNSDVLSVIEARLIANPDGISDGDALSAFFTDTWLGQTWRDYQSWEETNRSITEDGHVVIDFNLTRSRANYIARQESWIQDGEIYSVRVVTAENAPEELKYLLDGVAENVNVIDAYVSTPLSWESYFDNMDKHLIRFPETWEVTDAAEGLPATIVGDDVTMIVETLDVALDNEDAAIDWVQNWRTGVEALTVESVEVDGASGYEVSYKLTTLDGATESGLAVLLNGSDNRLHVANARISNTDVDLQTVSPEEYSVVDVLNTFRLFPDLNAYDFSADATGVSS